MFNTKHKKLKAKINILLELYNKRLEQLEVDNRKNKHNVIPRDFNENNCWYRCSRCHIKIITQELKELLEE